MQVWAWLKHEIHSQILPYSLGEKKPDVGKITGNKPTYWHE